MNLRILIIASIANKHGLEGTDTLMFHRMIRFVEILGSGGDFGR
jgi:hypothetical protein